MDLLFFMFFVKEGKEKRVVRKREEKEEGVGLGKEKGRGVREGTDRRKGSSVEFR
jgi:hypothetical protein